MLLSKIFVCWFLVVAICKKWLSPCPATISFNFVNLCIYSSKMTVNSSVDSVREKGLADYRKKLIEHKEVESRLKESKFTT